MLIYSSGRSGGPLREKNIQENNFASLKVWELFCGRLGVPDDGCLMDRLDEEIADK